MRVSHAVVFALASQVGSGSRMTIRRSAIGCSHKSSSLSTPAMNQLAPTISPDRRLSAELVSPGRAFFAEPMRPEQILSHH
jgi:hypothetical protein